MEKKGYVLVEGHGEVQAAGNLLNRLTMGLGIKLPWSTPIRWPNLHLKDGLVRGANFIRAKREAGALLVLRDEDDACPRDRGPEMAGWLRHLDLPVPSAAVLLHPEHEVLFLPCLERIAVQPLGDRPGLEENTVWDRESWEARRGVKEWLTRHFPPGRSYKPTVDQLPMTRMVEFDRLRAADLPCFGTRERAVAFLGRFLETGGLSPMSDTANRIVQKLWSYCNVLRDDGLSYQDYLEQLTFLLFLKNGRRARAAHG